MALICILGEASQATDEFTRWGGEVMNRSYKQ